MLRIGLSLKYHQSFHPVDSWLHQNNVKVQSEKMSLGGATALGGFADLKHVAL
jgi:cysteinyl-tRNA synthetase